MMLAPLPLLFTSYPAYLLPAMLVWLLVILMITALAAAWRESGLPPQMAALMLAVGGVACLIGTVFFIVVALAIHPVYS